MPTSGHPRRQPPLLAGPASARTGRPGRRARPVSRSASTPPERARVPAARFRPRQGPLARSRTGRDDRPGNLLVVVVLDGPRSVRGLDRLGHLRPPPVRPEVGHATGPERHRDVQGVALRTASTRSGATAPPPGPAGRPSTRIDRAAVVELPTVLAGPGGHLGDRTTDQVGDVMDRHPDRNHHAPLSEHATAADPEQETPGALRPTGVRHRAGATRSAGTGSSPAPIGHERLDPTERRRSGRGQGWCSATTIGVRSRDLGLIDGPIDVLSVR